MKKHTSNPTISVGDKFTTNYYGDIVVLEYNNANDIVVQFEDGNTRKVNSGSIRSGKIRNKLSKPNKNCRSSTEDFIRKANVKHKNKYDYSLVVYTAATDKIDIICKKCGVFSQLAGGHANGRGCPKCCRENYPIKSQEDFINEVTAVHNGKYDYSLSVYRGTYEKIDIICPLHGVFSQRATSHRQGSGCHKCKRNCGFKSSLPAKLYIMSSGEITKIGITNKNTNKRAKAITESSGKDFIVLKEYDVAGIVALNAETIILRELKKVYKNPSYTFDGWTECFLNVDQAWLVNRVEKEIYEEAE